ncbi:MAG TPA: polysaccharide lyase family protein [Acidobacteriaceae bacterium]|nr:polysaccharide lyase family protein [Acidobacteriaceae bacterium]
MSFIRRFSLLLPAALLFASAAALAAAPQHAPVSSSAPPVTITDSDGGATWTLSNGYLTIKVNKKTADLVSVQTPDTVTPNVELMGFVSGHHAGYWEQSPALAPRLKATITIDPKSNGGQRAEVSVKGFSDGQSILGPHPTAAGQGGGLIADLEIRYTLERGAHGLYTYAIYTHQASYPAGSVGESRFGFKLSSKVFDWLSIDAQRNALMPTGADWDAGDDLNMKEARRLTTGVYKGRAEHKYDYSADQFKIPAFGWASSTQKVGLYIINPSFEYLSSGPFHFELTGHIDDGDGGDPTLLDYWRGTHYGGSILNFSAGEFWTKTVGPIFVYVPTGDDPQGLYTDAKREAKIQQARWPFTFVKSYPDRTADYPQAAERATVTGHMKVVDPQYTSAKFTNLVVGLSFPDEPPAKPGEREPRAERPAAAPTSQISSAPRFQLASYQPPTQSAPATSPADASQDHSLLPNGKRRNRGTYVPPTEGRGPRRPGGFNFPRPTLNWQNDAKHYEFWTNAADDGSFTLPNVRPGTYQLHAVADGILGAYDATATITIRPGEHTLNLGTIEWHPVHYGTQVFQIGTPNRSAREFFKGNDHWHWGMYIEYAKLFPNDVDFTVGKSDPAKDWYIYQVPHDTDFHPDGRDQGRATPWTIHFAMPANVPARGKATLRFGLTNSARSLNIKVNGHDLGDDTDLRGGGGDIGRDGIEATWAERDFTFDASLLHPGPDNTIVLTVPAGPVGNGMCYDVIRLEVDPSASAPPQATASAVPPHLNTR